MEKKQLFYVEKYLKKYQKQYVDAGTVHMFRFSLY